MTIPVSDRLHNWLHNKGMQGYLKVADVEPHPRTAKIVNQIDVAKITNKQVHQFLNLKREGFDGTNPLEPTILRSYFIDYSPSAKAYKTEGGEDKLFQEVAKFLLEVAFVSPRFYCMPKQRAAFIIATYEGETVDWGYLIGEALWDQLKGV